MPLMIDLYRFYMLPLLVLFVGGLLSWAVFEYEYMQENAQFQVEYEFRAQGHTAAFQLGIQNTSSKVHSLAAILEHELNTGETNVLESNETFETFIQVFLADPRSIRDVMWYESSNSLTDTRGSPQVQALHAESVWDKHRMNSISNIVTLFHEVVESNTQGMIIIHQPDNQPWVYEIMPVVQAEGKLSWLIVSWDVGEALESILRGLPISGQDILFEFGKDFDISLDKEIQGGIKGKLGKAAYLHHSRSRLNHPFNRDRRAFQWSDNISILGRIWHIHYDSAPSFLITHPVKNAWNVFYGGLLMSALLSLLSLLLYRRTQLVQNLVHVKTHELNQAQQRIRLLVDSLAEGVFDMDAKGHCTFMNQRALDMLGYEDVDQVIGQEIHQLMHHRYPDGHTMPKESCRIAAVMQSGETVAVENEVFWRPDGSSFEVAYHATPVRDSENSLVGIVVTFLDISSQLAANREREEMRKQVEHTQRLESLGVLAGGIAHDFNNLLTSVIGNNDLALHYLDESSPAVKHLQRIDKASHHAADLCKQMLAYSGQGQLMMKLLHLSELVQDMGKLLDVSMSKLVHVDYQLASSIPLIHADQSQIQQVVMNLLTNANEAMGDKEGKVTVTTGVMTLENDFLEQCYLRPDQQADHYVFFEVDDNACGMDEETIDRMFEPFFTTKFTGRGLGMSAVLGIVRAHHGAMRIHSVVGKGTCMRILFPALNDEVDLHIPPKKVKAELPPMKSKNSTEFILVVDDEASLREIAGMMLEDMGYQVLFAENGAQALEVFAKYIDVIDAVLLDLTMPKMGGEECLKGLKNMHSDVRVLVSSGYSEVECTQFKHFLPKPYSKLLLQEKLEKMMAT